MNAIKKIVLASLAIFTAHSVQTSEGPSWWEASLRYVTRMVESKYDVDLETTLKGKGLPPEEQAKNYNSSQYKTFDIFNRQDPAQIRTAFTQAFADLTEKLQRKEGLIFFGPSSTDLLRRFNRGIFLREQEKTFPYTRASIPLITIEKYEQAARNLNAALNDIQKKIIDARPEAATHGKELYEQILANRYQPPADIDTEIQRSNMMYIVLYLYNTADQQAIHFTQGTFKVYDIDQYLYNALIRPPAYQRDASHGRKIMANGAPQKISFFGLDTDTSYRLPDNKLTILIWHDNEYHFTYIKPEDYPAPDSSGYGGSITGALWKPITSIAHGAELLTAQSVKQDIADLIQQARTALKTDPQSQPPFAAGEDDKDEYRKERIPLYVLNAWIYNAIISLALDDVTITIIAQRGIWDMILAISEWLGMPTRTPLTPRQKTLLTGFVNSIKRALAPQTSIFGRMGREIDGPVFPTELERGFAKPLQHWQTILHNADAIGAAAAH